VIAVPCRPSVGVGGTQGAMGLSDRPSSDDDDVGSGSGEGLSDEQYAWLQAELAQIGQLHITGDEGLDEEEGDWADPTGGLLVAVYAACESGDIDALRDAVAELSAASQTDPAAHGFGLHSPGPEGDTALHLACLYGHMECVRLLLDAGAPPGAINPEDGTSALHDAAAGGYGDAVAALLAATGTSLLGIRDVDGDTALHNAARGGHLAVVQALLTAGADPAALNDSGKTPAGESDDADVVRMLVAAAAARLSASAGNRCGAVAGVPAVCPPESGGQAAAGPVAAAITPAAAAAAETEREADS
jgi:Ankyrin repeats (3 copies)/Ankyrin repeat